MGIWFSTWKISLSHFLFSSSCKKIKYAISIFSYSVKSIQTWYSYVWNILSALYHEELLGLVWAVIIWLKKFSLGNSQTWSCPNPLVAGWLASLVLLPISPTLGFNYSQIGLGQYEECSRNILILVFGYYSYLNFQTILVIYVYVMKRINGGHWSSNVQ